MRQSGIMQRPPARRATCTCHARHADRLLALLVAAVVSNILARGASGAQAGAPARRRVQTELYAGGGIAGSTGDVATQPGGGPAVPHTPPLTAGSLLDQLAKQGARARSRAKRSRQGACGDTGLRLRLLRSAPAELLRIGSCCRGALSCASPPRHPTLPPDLHPEYWCDLLSHRPVPFAPRCRCVMPLP